MRRCARPLLFLIACLGALAMVGCEPPPAPPGVTQVSVAAGHGFGGGTIYYPTGATGRRGAMVAVGGFTETQSAVEVYGPLLANAGFVVFTIDTNSIFDSPSARADQLLAAVDYLSASSPVAHLVDPARVGVMGHSMGGGGSLIAAAERPSLKAAIPMAPWNSGSTNFSAVHVPTLFVTCQNDSIAPNDSHSLPFYASISNATPKEYIQIAGQGHMCTNAANTVADAQIVAWVKHFLNGDHTAVVCPPPAVGAALSKSMSSCPF